MKKTLFILCALLLTAVGARADEDYSSYMQTASTSGWTGPTATQGGGNGPAVMDFGMEAYAYISSADTYWPSTGKVLYQTISGLPAGTYEVKFNAFARVARTISAEAYGGTGIAQAYACVSNSTPSTEQTKSVDIPTTYVASHGGWADADLCTFTVTLSDGESLEYGLQNLKAGGQWYGIKEVSLVLKNSTTQTYEVNAVVEEEQGSKSSLDHWRESFALYTATNGALGYNTWSAENGMTNPYHQLHVAIGDEKTTTLSDVTIYHKELVGLPAGLYTVTVDARVLSEADNSISNESAYFCANDASVDIVENATTDEDFSYGGSTEHEDNGTYTLVATVDEAGSLDIHFSIKSATYNWISWKNLSVTYLGTELSYSIGAPTCAASCVKPGGTVTITFPNCTTPNATETPVLDSSKSIKVNSTEVAASLSYSGTTATVTFTMPENVGYGEMVTITVPAGLLTWSNTEVASVAAEFTLSTPIMADQEGVYILSVYDNEFLSRGYNYGTAADVDRYGVPVNIVFGDDGTATVEYMDSKLYLYGPNWAWSDAAAANASHYTIVAVDGQDGVYQFLGGTGEDNYPMYVYDETAISVNDNNTYRVANNGMKTNSGYEYPNYVYDEQTYWKILTRTERDAIKDAWVLGEYQEIAASFGATISSQADFEAFLAALGEGTDATEKVTGATLTNITANDTGSNGWGIKYPTENSHSGYASDENCTEMLESDGDLYQNVEGLDPGLYKVTLKGFIRHGWYDTCVEYQDYDLSYAYLRANDYEINLVPWVKDATLSNTNADYSTSTPNNMENAGAAFDSTNPSKYDNTLYTIVGDDGTLSIEIACPGWLSSEWTCIRDLTLTYYGNQDVITWEMTSAGYGTIILPFDAEIPTTDDNNNAIEWTAYSTGTVTLDDDESGNATLSLNEVTASDGKITLKANTPYIMAGTAGTYTFTGTPETAANDLTEGKLTGTYETMDCAALLEAAGSNTVYLLQNHDGDVAFYPVVQTSSADATLTPYHCYLTLTDSDLQTSSSVPAKLSFSFGGEATGIVAVEGAEAEANGAIYDLSGRKVSKVVKGVYIQNGKKVLVK